MPTRVNGEPLTPFQYLPLFKILVKSAMMILQREQQRLNTGGREEALQLQEELIRYAYNQAPFDSQYWDPSTKPLDYWQRLSNDSNAKQIGALLKVIQRIAVKVSSIFPSEICDEPQFFQKISLAVLASTTFTLTGSPKGPTPTKHMFHSMRSKSAPSLMDLLHNENISPSEVDRDALEDLLFNHPDPYDLAETDRYDLPQVTRSRSVFAIAEYIKLDSPALAELLKPSEPDADVSMEPAPGTQAGRPDDWNLEDLLS
ncbi:hypothetical protein C8R44DRAFT_746139 [Mycena epipterygia]|nr:hypothetical protein C8R44DRAFT_746139 [Mycena epipterygia]